MRLLFLWMIWTGIVGGVVLLLQLGKVVIAFFQSFHPIWGSVALIVFVSLILALGTMTSIERKMKKKE